MAFKVVCADSWPERGGKRGRHRHSGDGDTGRNANAAAYASTAYRKYANQRSLAALYIAPDQKAVDCELFGGRFLDLFMPAGYESRSVVMFPGGWVSLFPTIFHGKDSLLNKSLLALYTGFIGRRRDDPGLVSRGMDLYVDALRLLHESDIWTCDKTHPDLDSKLASIIVFSRCELFIVQAGSGGYMTHIRGGLRLLNQFATTLPRNDLTKTIVKKFRILGVSIALGIFITIADNSSSFTQ